MLRQMVVVGEALREAPVTMRGGPGGAGAEFTKLSRV